MGVMKTHDKKRLAAFWALYNIEKGKYSNVAFEESTKGLAGSELAFARELVFGTLKLNLKLDYAINYLKDKRARIKLKDRILLRLGLYQLDYMDSVPDYAAVNETIAIAKKLVKNKVGLINAILRGYIRKKQEIEDSIDDLPYIERLAVRYSYPIWFVQEVLNDEVNSSCNKKVPMNLLKQEAEDNETISVARKRDLSSSTWFARKSINGVDVSGGASDYGVIIYDNTDDEVVDKKLIRKVENILRAGNEKAPLCIRTNLKKITREELAEKINELGIGAVSGKATGAINIKGSGIFDTELYKKGYFSVQDESSQLAIEALDIKDCKVLDLCCGRGGKTFAIIEQCKNVEVISMDKYEHKILQMKDEAKRLGHEVNIAVNDLFDGNNLDKHCRLYDTIKYVILDVPCTGSGTVRRRPEIKYAGEDNKLANLVKLQKALLERGAKLTNAEDHLVYMTCSIFQKENMDNIDAFLKKHSEFKLLQYRQYTPEKDGTDGFFFADLKRGS